MKPKDQFIYPNEENEFAAQSLKERKVLCESVFILTERQTLFLQKFEREVFFLNQSINIIYPNGENVFTAPNHKTKGDYYLNPCLS